MYCQLKLNKDGNCFILNQKVEKMYAAFIAWYKIIQASKVYWLSGQHTHYGMYAD
jgi:hypothetical protein